MKKFKRQIIILLIDIGMYALIMGLLLLYFYVIPYSLDSDGDIVGDSGALESFTIPDGSSSAKRDDAEELTSHSPQETTTKERPSQKPSSETDSAPDTMAPEETTAEPFTEPADEKHTESPTDETFTEPATEATTPYRQKVYNDGNFSLGKDYDNIGVHSVRSSAREASYITDNITSSTQIGSYITDSVNITVKKNVIGDNVITYYIADIYVSNLSLFRTALAYDSYGSNIRQMLWSFHKTKTLF